MSPLEFMIYEWSSHPVMNQEYCNPLTPRLPDSVIDFP